MRITHAQSTKFGKSKSSMTHTKPRSYQHLKTYTHSDYCMRSKLGNEQNENWAIWKTNQTYVTSWPAYVRNSPPAWKKYMMIKKWFEMNECKEKLRKCMKIRKKWSEMYKNKKGVIRHLWEIKTWWETYDYKEMIRNLWRQEIRNLWRQEMTRNVWKHENKKSESLQ